MGTWGGKRIGAGRYPAYRQQRDFEITQKKSMHVVIRCLRDESIPLIQRARLGMDYIAKFLPDKVETVNLDVSLDNDLLTRLITLIDSSTLAYNTKTDKVIDVTPTDKPTADNPVPVVADNKPTHNVPSDNLNSGVGGEGVCVGTPQP